MKRIESLTFLRFIAALIVVVFHFGRETQLANRAMPFIISGPQMVSLFFVLSGFVMMIAYYDDEGKTTRDYYISRVARITPVYFLALSLSIYLFFGTDNNNGIAVLLHFMFLQSWFPSYASSLNGPAWSLSAEAFFYLTFPLVIFVVKKSGVSWQKLVLISLFFYLFTQAILSNMLGDETYSGFPSTAHALVHYFPLSHYCSFILGVTGGFVYLKNTQWFNKTGFIPFIVFSLCVFINVALLQYPEIIGNIAGFPLAFRSSFYAPLFLLLVLGFAHSQNIFTRILSKPAFVLLGEASYSIYILQTPLYTIFTKYMSNYLKTGPDGSFYLFSIFLVIFSILIFHIVEKPGKKIILDIHRKYLQGKNGNIHGQRY